MAHGSCDTRPRPWRAPRSAGRARARSPATAHAPPLRRARARPRAGVRRSVGVDGDHMGDRAEQHHPYERHVQDVPEREQPLVTAELRYALRAGDVVLDELAAATEVALLAGRVPAEGARVHAVDARELPRAAAASPACTHSQSQEAPG